VSELGEAIRGRRSVRRFRDAPVSRETILGLVELAAWAPSAGNRQDWLFTAVTSAQTKRAMAEAVRRRWREICEANRASGFIAEVERYAARFADFESAPAVVVISARRPEAVQRHLLGDADAAATAGSAASAAMAAQNFMLAAGAAGLGTCCMTGALAARGELARLAGLGRKEEIVCLVTLGWPEEAPAPPPRRPLEQITRFPE
jgi:nitroreductase